MGLAGTIAAKYLIERKKFKQVGFIDSSIFVPVIRIHEGLPVYPSRVYINESMKLAVLISEQIIPKSYTNAFADEIVEWIKKKKFKSVISLAGISTGEEENNEVYGIGANEKSKEMLKKFKVKVIDDGITTGTTALILLKLRDLKIPAISIMGTVQLGADYKAAASLVEKLNEILGLKIEIKPLLEEAKETEEMLLKQMDEMKKTEKQLERREEYPPMIS